MQLTGEPKIFHSKIQRFLLGNAPGEKRMPGLDVLRSIAILSVIISHFWPYYIRNGVSAIVHDFVILIGGYMGVEIFFVLSGFLIGKIIIDLYWKSNGFDFKTIKGFWIRRWFRTLPNYLLVLMIYIIISSKNGTYGIGTYITFLFFFQNFASLHLDFFPVSWSLSIEEWFYLLLPLVLGLFGFLLKGQKKKTLISTVLFFLIGTTIVRFIYIRLYPHTDWDYLRKLLMCRLDSLMYGVGAAIIYRYRLNWWKRIPVTLFIAGVVLIVLLSTVLMRYDISGTQPNPIIKAALFSFVSFSIALLLPFMTNLQIRNAWANLFFSWVSLISYSLYLIHEFIITLTYRLIGAPNAAGNSITAMLLFIFLLFTIATLQYHFFEKPLTNLRDKFRS